MRPFADDVAAWCRAIPEQQQKIGRVPRRGPKVRRRWFQSREALQLFSDLPIDVGSDCPRASVYAPDHAKQGTAAGTGLARGYDALPVVEREHRLQLKRGRSHAMNTFSFVLENEAQPIASFS